MSRPEGSAPTRESLPVLIAEDDVELREALCDLLDAEGIPVVRADDGEEALSLLRSGLRPAAVLLDLAMPRMDGVEFRRRQLADDPAVAAVPVVVLSGWEEGREEMKRLGVSAVLRKPVTPRRLFEVLRTRGRWIPPPER